MRNILVISPHPDDESIGCGGTICHHVAKGDDVHVIFLTSGEKGGHGRPEIETISIREEEALEASKILKIKSIDFWRQPDGRLKATESLVRRLHDLVDSLNLEIIYVPHVNEKHPDHQAAATLVRNTLENLGERVKPVVYMYEVWTPIQKMNHIVDITSFVEQKKAAIQKYITQCEVMAFDEAILGLNRYRGEMFSWPEGEYAEVFEVMT